MQPQKLRAGTATHQTSASPPLATASSLLPASHDSPTTGAWMPSVSTSIGSVLSSFLVSHTWRGRGCSTQDEHAVEI